MKDPNVILPPPEMFIGQLWGSIAKFAVPVRTKAALLPVLALLLLICNVAIGQQPAELEQGMAAGKSYHGGSLDQVNLGNGNVTVAIPLISYPQLGGKLSFGFHIAYNGKGWVPTAGNGKLGWANRNQGVQVVFDKLYVQHTAEYYTTDPNNPPVCSAGDCPPPACNEYNNYCNGKSPDPGGGEPSSPYQVCILFSYDPIDCQALPAKDVASLPHEGTVDHDFMHALYHPPFELDRVDSRYRQLVFPVSGPHQHNKSKPTFRHAGFYQSGGGVNLPPNGPGYLYIYDTVALDADAGSHQFGTTGSKSCAGAYAVDGSGLLCASSSSIVDADGTTYNFGPQPVVSAELSPIAGSVTAGTIADVNGNTITLDSNGWHDTIGRTIPTSPVNGWNIPGSPSSASVCPTVDSGASLGSAYTENFPSATGTSPYIFCFENLTIQSSFNVAYYGDSTFKVQWLYAIILPNTTTWRFSYTSNGDLSSITFPTGGSIVYGYSLSPCSSSLPATRSVFSRTLNSATGTTSEWTYSYSSTARATTVTNPDNSSFTAYGTCSDGTNLETGRDFYDSSGNRLKSTKIEHALNSDTGSSVNPFSLYFPNILINPEVTAETVSYPVPGQSQDLATRTQYNYDSGAPVTFVDAVAKGYNTFYNTTQPVNIPYTVVLGSRTCQAVFDYAIGTPTVPLSATNTTYQWQANAAYATANLLELPSVVSTSDGSGESGSSPSCTGTVYGQTTYSYDANNGSPQGARGNLTSTSRSLSATSALTISSTVWNNNGMAIKHLDALNNPTTIGYDSTYGLYPQTVTQPAANGVQHVDQYQYDFPSGLLSSHTDQNKQKFSTTYDNMSRPLLVSLPDGGSGQFTYVDSSYAPSVQLTKKINSSQSSVVSGMLDGFGREVRHLVTDSTCSTGQIETDTQYDWAGRTSSVSNPYCTSGDESYGFTTSTYDGLGRPSQIVRADKSIVAMTYLGNAVSTVDSNNGNYPIQSIVGSDGLGRIISACEVAADPQHKLAGVVSFLSCGPSQSGLVLSALGSGVLTHYTYDPLGNLKSVIQPNNSVRQFNYDWLSRLTSSTNPETGNVTYAYGTQQAKLCSGDVDALCSKTDARGVTLTNTYNDPLNRLTSKSYSDGGTTPSVLYQYDTSNESGAALTIGRMTYESTIQGGSTQTKRAFVAFDPVGRVNTEWQCVAPSCASPEFSFSYKYDLSGNLIQWNNGLIGTNSFSFSAGYDNVSRFSTLTATQNTTNLGTLYNVDQWGPVGLKIAHHTTNVSTARNYDVRARLVKEIDSHVIAGGGTPSTATVTIAGQEGYSCTPPPGGNNGNVATVATSGATSNGAGTGGCVKLPDQGTVFITVNGFSAQANYTATSTIATITSSLTSQLNGSSSPVTASSSLSVTGSSSSGTIYLTTRSTGTATTYPITAGGGDFYAQVAGTNMAGGEDSIPGSPNALYNFATTYAPNSNIAGVADSATGTWTFGYDEFNRMQTATATTGVYAGAAIAWSFDVNGNRWSQSATGNSSGQLVQTPYTYSGKSLLNGNSPSSPLGNNNRIDYQNYDAAGDQMSGPAGPNQYAYDAEGRLSTVNGTMKYIYDAEGRRVAKGSLNGGVFTPTNVFALGLTGDQVTEVNGQGTWLHTNVFANGGMVATYDAKGAHVHFDDWLGTRRVQATLSGAVELVCSGLPFGDSLNCTGSGSDATEHHFTGKERDAESGLDYFGARYYASNMGRYMSPDWSAKQEPVPYSKLDNPQTLNLYSYVQNNPLSNFDNDGHATIEVKYNPLSLGSNHSFIVITDRDGTQTVFRAGPSVSAGTGWITPATGGAASQSATPTSSQSDSSNQSSPGAGPTAQGNPYGQLVAQQEKPNEGDNADPISGAVTVLSNDLPASSYINGLQQFDSGLNSANIPYNPLSTNSNAYVTNALQSIGVPTPKAPVWAPGAGTNLHVTPAPPAPPPPPPPPCSVAGACSTPH